MDNLLASGIADAVHLQAFDQMIEERFANLDVGAVLIYLIDTVKSDALPILAEQFDVLGYKGFGLASTEQQQRDVIKKAIELHRYKGTPWSIKEALKAVGYYNAVIQERYLGGIIHDGTVNHNASELYGTGYWADFRVIIDLGSSGGINATSAAEAVKLILEYKNARSRLLDVSYTATLVEYVTGVTEELEVNVVSNVDDVFGLYYDSAYIYKGAQQHGGADEALNLTIQII